jgi:putative resolvase
LLADPKMTTVVVEHRDQLAHMHVDLIQAALTADGRQLVAGR